MTAGFRLRFVSLKLESYSAAEERGYRRHCAACSDEGRHESGAADLFVAEVHGGSRVTKLEIFHEFVIGGESSWWAAEFLASSQLRSLRTARHSLGRETIALRTFSSICRLRMPQAGCGEAAARLKVQIEAGRMNVFAAM